MLLDDAAANSQAQSGASLITRVGGVNLLKPLEDSLELFGRNTPSMVLYLEQELVSLTLGAQPHGLTPRGKLDGIREQVGKSLDHAVRVGPQTG